MTMNPIKLFRWKYILPRLAIVLVIGLVVRLGLDPTLKWALVTGGESAVGAKVEVAKVVTSLWDGHLVVEEMAIANPQSPMRNLLETTDAQLQLDVNALLHGRVVVTDGTLDGLQFDTDRATSGALANEDSEAAQPSGPSVFDPLLASASDMGEQWLDDLENRLNVDIADQLASPRLAKELQERWPRQVKDLEQQIKDIRSRGKQLEQSIREVKSNPLRGLEKLPSLQQEVAQLQQEVKSVQEQIGQLPKQAEADKQAVLAAREQDEQFIRQKLQIGKLDDEGLTQTLLGKPVTEGLQTALGWIGWAREQVPTSAAETKELRGRGTTVRFTPPQPDYLIERLEINGLAQLGGKPLRLTGTLTGASSAPHLLDEPTLLELRGSEALDLNMIVELDRRGETPRDQVRLTCPRLEIPGQSLGNANKLAIQIADGVAEVQVELTLEGDELVGDIRFAQDSLTLTPRLAKSKNAQLSAALGEALAGVERLEANVALAGTLKKPKVKIESDIGSQVAAGLNSAVANLVKRQADGLLAKSRQQVDAQLQQLTKLREEAQQNLLAQLGEGQELLGQLAALSGGGGQPGGLPAGIPQLGKKFGLDSLRK